VVLDGDRIERGADLGWAEAQARASAGIHAAYPAEPDRRKAVHDLLIGDLLPDLAQAAMQLGLDPAQAAQWVATRSQKGLSLAPSVGVYAEMFHGRHSDPATAWERNDVLDMVFLSCAAAYADVVVCERHAAGVLNNAVARLGRSTRAYRRLRDTVPVIEEMLNENQQNREQSRLP